jgi:hypothetical protein
MELPLEAYQRLIIATDLVQSSVDCLQEINTESAEAQATTEDLCVALYELNQLSQDLRHLVQPPSPSGIAQGF